MARQGVERFAQVLRLRHHAHCGIRLQVSLDRTLLSIGNSPKRTRPDRAVAKVALDLLYGRSRG